MGIHRRPQALRHLGIITALLLLVACRANDAGVCDLYKTQESRQETVAGGEVTRILGTRVGPSGTHEGFLLKMSNGCDLTVRVETNVDLTGPVPLSLGEHVTVRGEYEYYPLGGVIHWTHHDPRGRHPGGYIISDGRVYQ